MARPRGRVSRGPRRRTQWVGPADQNYVSVAAGGATLLALFSFAEAATIVRLRGQVSFHGASAADLSMAGAVGICMVSDEAFAAGVTAVPEPFTDADWSGWFWWQAFTGRFEVQDTTGSLLQSWQIEIDSKVMRKVGPNETAVIVCESQSGAFQIATPVRMLVKLA